MELGILNILTIYIWNLKINKNFSSWIITSWLYPVLYTLLFALQPSLIVLVSKYICLCITFKISLVLPLTNSTKSQNDSTFLRIPPKRRFCSSIIIMTFKYSQIYSHFFLDGTRNSQYLNYVHMELLDQQNFVFQDDDLMIVFNFI